MIDLSTTYMGIPLKNPIVPSASHCRRAGHDQAMADAGAAAVTLPSLFEEQIEFEAESLSHFMELGTYSYAESLTTFRRSKSSPRPKEYVEHIRKACGAVDIPIIASLNASAPAAGLAMPASSRKPGAPRRAEHLLSPTKSQLTGEEVEQLYLSIVEDVNSMSPSRSPSARPFLQLAAQHRASGRSRANALVLFTASTSPTWTSRPSKCNPPGTEQIGRDATAAALDRHPVWAGQGIAGPDHRHPHTGRCAQGGHGWRRRGQHCSVLLQQGVDKIGDLLCGSPPGWKRRIQLDL